MVPPLLRNEVDTTALAWRGTQSLTRGVALRGWGLGGTLPAGSLPPTTLPFLAAGFQEMLRLLPGWERRAEAADSLRPPPPGRSCTQGWEVGNGLGLC